MAFWDRIINRFNDSSARDRLINDFNRSVREKIIEEQIDNMSSVDFMHRNNTIKAVCHPDRFQDTETVSKATDETAQNFFWVCLVNNKLIYLQNKKA